jgi:hypothetical protein
MNSDQPLVLLETAWTELQRQKERIYEEIHDYPRPIAACDLQFNYLLEERARVAEELARMQRERETLAKARSGPETPQETEEIQKKT